MRTDVHAPKTLDPSQYTLDVDDKGVRSVFTTSGQGLVDRTVALQAQGINKARHQQALDTCGHCGHQHLVYCAIVIHTAKREWIIVGETCLSERFQGLTKQAFQELRKIAKAKRNLEAYMSNNPAVAGLPELAQTNTTARSLVFAIKKYGSLTDRQYAFAVSLLAPKEDAPVVYASDKQVAFIESLLRDRTVPAELLASVGEPSKVNKSQASAIINALKECAIKERANAPVEEGLYYKSGDIFKVQRSQSSGRLYAKRLDGTSFRYDPFGVKSLTADNLLTLEQAKAYGIQFGVCAICGRTLTDEQSIEQGIGPVCITKFN